MTVVDIPIDPPAGDGDHTVVMMRAVAALEGRPGLIRMPAGRITLSATIFLTSGVQLRGAGPDQTLVVFRGEHPDRIAARPRLGILRSSAFVAAGTCPQDNYAPDTGELGDYYISPPRRLAGRSEPGATRVLATDAAQLYGIRAGDWIHFWSGPSGWHPALSEIAQDNAIEGAAITLSDPLDNGYDAGNTGLGAFVERFDHTANPPGGARIDRWPHTGFRLVRPIENVVLSDFAILNGNTTPQYGGRAYCFARARRCAVRNVRLLAGWGWHVDCQDITCDVAMRCDEPALPVGVLFNGSSRVDARCISKEGSLLIEEGVQRMTVRASRFDLDQAGIVIGQYCRDIRLLDIHITNASSYGLSVRKSRDVVISGEIVAAGSALRYETPPANAEVAGHPAVAPYFDGRTVLLDHCSLRSTRNPGYDLWLQQPVSARNSVLAGSQGAPFLAVPVRPGGIVGSLVRSADAREFGS